MIRRRKMVRVIKWSAGILIAAVVGFGIYFLNGAMPIGTGYSAKYICSQVFLAQRDPVQVFENDVKPTHPLFKPVSLKVDMENKTVTSAAFGFWKSMTAVYREGCGCTLAVDTTREALLAQSEQIRPVRIERNRDMWPNGQSVDIQNLPSGVDKVKLNATVKKAFKEPGPETQRNTQAVVVVFGNRIIAENYAEGFDKDTPMLGWSMSKSVTNTLAGILVNDGLLDKDLQAPVSAWASPGDPRNKITLDMLLRMSSGLVFEEIYAPFKDVVYMLYTSRSMADYAVAKPLEFEPDTHWYYSGGTTNIIARIVTNTVGGSLADFVTFANERLFHKIKAYSAVIEPDASGSFVGSSYMFATARDWARFGLFLKNGGTWEGEQILPKGWVAYSTTPTPKASKGQYGAQFWLNAGDKENPENRLFPSLPRDLYYCGGFNGQIVAVIPSRDLVVVRLGVTHDDSWDHEYFIKQVIESVKGNPDIS